MSQNANRYQQKTEGSTTKRKRTKRTVVETRWEQKEQTGRIVKDEDHSYVKQPIKALNDFQKEFLDSLHNYQIVVVDASAGVGKSFITASTVADWLKKGFYDRVLLSRPAVGMGNTLGLLTGDLRAKYEPFLRPLVDVFVERYGKGFYEAGLANGTLEYCPLEYVRGRNFNCVAIVDEFQNVEPSYAYTLLTRVAEGGKLICLGDSTQNDLRGQTGLQWIEEFVTKHNLQDRVKIVKATSDDIVRSDICKDVVKAMEADRKQGFKFKI